MHELTNFKFRKMILLFYFLLLYFVGRYQSHPTWLELWFTYHQGTPITSSFSATLEETTQLSHYHHLLAKQPMIYSDGSRSTSADPLSALPHDIVLQDTSCVMSCILATPHPSETPAWNSSYRIRLTRCCKESLPMTVLWRPMAVSITHSCSRINAHCGQRVKRYFLWTDFNRTTEDRSATPDEQLCYSWCSTDIIYSTARRMPGKESTLVTGSRLLTLT